MTVQELMDRLLKLDPNAKVGVYQPDHEGDGEKVIEVVGADAYPNVIALSAAGGEL